MSTRSVRDDLALRPAHGGDRGTDGHEQVGDLPGDPGRMDDVGGAHESDEQQAIAPPRRNIALRCSTGSASATDSATRRCAASVTAYIMLAGADPRSGHMALSDGDDCEVAVAPGRVE